MRRVLVWIVGAMLVLAGPASLHLRAAAPQSAERASEYEVKAAFLFNFAKFVDWPPDSSTGATAITICVFGVDPFGPILEDVTRGQRINGRDILIRRPGGRDDLRSCHILFVSQSERRRVAEVLAMVRGASVLTVADMEGFTESGGVIRLTRDASRIGLEISLGAADRAGLKISSRLLSLARIVESKPEGRAPR